MEEKYYCFGSSSCIDFESQDELHCNFGPAHLYFMTLMCVGLFDVCWICGGLSRMDESCGTETVTRTLTDTKTNNYCDWSSTKVLAVPIALTSKVT
jgi:hypothetical protein